MEQLKIVFGMSTPYASRAKGSRLVTLVHKWGGRFDPNTEMDLVPQGWTLSEWLENRFFGDVKVVTGLPGKR